jgi:hypothetical protein
MSTARATALPIETRLSMLDRLYRDVLFKAPPEPDESPPGKEKATEGESVAEEGR